MAKVMIQAQSGDTINPLAHLEPIVEALINSDNSVIGQGVFNFDRDGWYCLLDKPIDFDLLESLFEFPKNIQLSRKDDSILDTGTWIEIRGGRGVP